MKKKNIIVISIILIGTLSVGGFIYSNKQNIKKEAINEIINEYSLTNEEVSIIKDGFIEGVTNVYDITNIRKKIDFYKKDTFYNIELNAKEFAKIKESLNITDELIKQFDVLEDEYLADYKAKKDIEDAKAKELEESLYGHILIAENEKQACEKVREGLISKNSKFGVFDVECTTNSFSTNIVFWVNHKQLLRVADVVNMRLFATDLAQEFGIIRNKTVKVTVKQAVEGAKDDWENIVGEYSFELGKGWDKEVK